MNCPYCNEEMVPGVIQSQRQIFFTSKEDKNCFIPDVACRDEIMITTQLDKTNVQSTPLC